MNKYLGIIGAAGVGKDTTADAVIAMGDSWSKLSFAAPLKEVVSKVFNIPLAALHSLEEKEKAREPIIIDQFLLPLEVEINRLIEPKFGCSSNYKSLKLQPRNLIANSYRQLLQYVGTDYVRSVRDSFWVDYVRDYQIPLHKNVVLPDTRFENEIKVVHDLGGLVFAVERGNVEFTNDHTSARDLRSLADRIVYFPTDGFSHIKRWAQLFVHNLPQWKMYESNRMRAFLNAYKNDLPLDDCAAILGVGCNVTLHQLAIDYGVTCVRNNNY